MTAKDPEGRRTARGSSWHRPLLGVALLVTAFALTWFRVPKQSRYQLWAEDGRRFLGEALSTSDPLGNLLAPYAGYLHFIPRVVAAMTAALFDVDHFPIVMTALSILASSAIAVMIFFLSWHLGLGAVGRFGVYGATFLAPALSTEILGNTANLHWFFLWLAPWLFLHRPSRAREGVLWGLVGLAAALTEIQLVLFLPLLLWRPRVDHRLWLAGGAVSGAVAQILTTVSYPRSITSPPFEPTWSSVSLVARGFTAHVGGGLWNATTPGPGLLGSLGWMGTSTLLLAPPAIALMWLLHNRSRRLLGLYFFAAAGLLWVASSVLNNLPNEVLLPLQSVESAVPTGVLRHAVVPAWLLLAVIIVVVDEVLRGRPARLGAVAASLLCALVLSTWAANYYLDPWLRQQPSSWSEEVERARTECSSGTADSVILHHPPATWGMAADCDAIKARS